MKKYILILFLILSRMVLAQTDGAGTLEDTIHFVGQASAFTVGENLVTNEDFESAGGGGTEIFTDWTNDINAGDGTDEITIVGAGEFYGGAGTGACNLKASGGAPVRIWQTPVLTIGKIYRATFTVWINAGELRVSNASANIYGSFSTNGNKSLVFKAVVDQRFLFLRHTVANTDITIDNVEVVEWVGDPEAGGGCTIATFTGDLLDYMTASGGVLVSETGLNWDQPTRTMGGFLVVTTDLVIGTLVNISGTQIQDGIYAITGIPDNDSLEFADVDSDGSEIGTVTAHIGGAFPDIATALGDSTISEGWDDDIHRKRYIMVNVPQKVDEVTVFVAEANETALREDDGSRKLIGYRDSFRVVSLKDGTYNVVSDCDEGQEFYGGAISAFQFDEGFTLGRPAAITISEKVTNGAFETPGGGGTEVFDGWNNVTQSGTVEVQDVDEGQFHGGSSGTTHAANVWTTGDTQYVRTNNILTVGASYRLVFDLWVNTGGARVTGFIGTNYTSELSTNGTKVVFFTAADTGVKFVRHASEATDFTIDNVSITEVVTPGWIEIDAQGNDINIFEMNTSNLEFRNLRIHNTAIGGTNALLHVDAAHIFNAAFVNCLFATADLLMVSDNQIRGSIFKDCYFDNSIISNQQSKIIETGFVGCITNGNGRNSAADGFTNRSWYNCLFYKGNGGVIGYAGSLFSNCTFFDQAKCVVAVDAESNFTVINCIFSPLATTNFAIQILNGGSLNPASRNNIMYSVTGGGVLTNPISHNQITPNPPLPVGTLQVDPLFVDPANGDFRLQAASPARNTGIEDIFSGKSTIGIWQPTGGGYGPGIGSGIGR